MSEPEAKLLRAIERCYTEFANMPCPRKLDASPLRDADEILQTLTSAPLRELEGEKVGPYSGWAITTVGNDRDYRYFLPRIFELAVTDPVWFGMEPAVIASKLNMAGWRTWPAEQQGAVLHYFHSALDAAVEKHPDVSLSAESWFCGIMALGEPASPTFERWRSSSLPNAALQMASFINLEAKKLCRRAEVRGSFWEEVSDDVRRAVGQLLLEKRTTNMLQSAAGRVSDEDRYLLDLALAELLRQF